MTERQKVAYYYTAKSGVSLGVGGILTWMGRWVGDNLDATGRTKTGLTWVLLGATGMGIVRNVFSYMKFKDKAFMEVKAMEATRPWYGLGDSLTAGMPRMGDYVTTGSNAPRMGDYVTTGSNAPRMGDYVNFPRQQVRGMSDYVTMPSSATQRFGDPIGMLTGRG